MKTAANRGVTPEGREAEKGIGRSSEQHSCEMTRAGFGKQQCNLASETNDCFGREASAKLKTYRNSGALL